LLAWKRRSPEVGEIPKIKVLNRFIEEELDVLKVRIDALKRSGTPDWEPLNELFLKAFEGSV